MIVDGHVGWDTNGYFSTRRCGTGNLAENTAEAPHQPAGRFCCVAGSYRERWLMKDSSAILLFWSGKISQPRM